MIYYFSGTGNSRWVAEECAEMLNVDAYSIVESDVKDEDAVGIVFPCYCAALPKIVSEWVKRQNWDNKKYVWAICTCGGNGGRSFSQLKEMIPSFKFGADLVMPDNCVIFAHKPEKVAELLKTAPARLGEIVDEIKDYRDNKDKFKNNVLAKIFTSISWGGLKVAGEGRKSVNIEKCSQCNKCIRVCPTNNITRVGKELVFGDKCAHCFACLQYCPKRAISYGTIVPNDRTGYIHPKYKDI